jgi:D-3-phosphoglycerate dehydrogenase / 2-oxoglutarate reductase
MKVLVKEKIGDSGIELLRSRGFTVDVGTDWSQEDLERRIGEYDGLLIRSATKVTAELLAKATNLRVVGRAGVGVDNVDVPAATKRGIVVANAPESNVVTAAEHTMALLLALARNIPQAHSSLVAGRWERSKYSGVELMDKTLGIIGFGRIGQLVAQRAQGFGMRVIAFDPFVGAERYRDLGVEKGESPDDVYAAADFITIHLPKSPETANWLNAEAFAKMRDGVRVLNVARGGLVDEAALKDALDAGKVAGAALDVFPAEPTTEHPLFGYPNVVVTPHLGASTAEATDRAGYQAAEQVVAALDGGTVTSAVNMPAIAAEDLEVVGPFVPLCTALGRFATAMAQGMSIERVEVELLGKVGERDARPLSTAVLLGVLGGHTEEDLNAVNVHTVAADRGIELVESRRANSPDFSDIIRVTVSSSSERVRVVGTTLGRRHRPHLLEAWGQRFNLQLEPYVTLLKYQDVPGMIGKLGTCFGRHGLNIELAAVGHPPDDEPESEQDGPEAVMAVTTDQPVPAAVIDEIVEADGFVAGRFVSLAGALD